MKILIVENDDDHFEGIVRICEALGYDFYPTKTEFESFRNLFQCILSEEGGAVKMATTAFVKAVSEAKCDVIAFDFMIKGEQDVLKIWRALQTALRGAVPNSFIYSERADEAKDTFKYIQEKYRPPILPKPSEITIAHTVPEYVEEFKMMVEQVAKNHTLPKANVWQRQTADSVKGEPCEALSELSDPIGLHAIPGTDKPDRIADVVFIHGLGGGSQTTWAHDGAVDNFFPLWIAEEYPKIGIWTLGYESSISEWENRTLPIEDFDALVLQRLANKKIGDVPIIFIAHSMGGIVLKHILDSANTGADRFQKIVKMTTGVAFIAVPHDGSNLANFSSLLRMILRLSDQTVDLEKHSDRLRGLNKTFKHLAEKNKYYCRAYAERNPIKKGVKIFKYNVVIEAPMLVVDKSSAEPGIGSEEAIPLYEDHFSICKPVNKSSDIYMGMRELIEKCLTS